MSTKTSIMILLVGTSFSLGAGPATQPAAQSKARSSMQQMKVACVSIPAQADIGANTRSVIAALEREAKEKTRLVVFSECILSSYDQKTIRSLTQEQIDAALEQIKAACVRFNLYAVVGSPYYENGKRYNGAFVLGPNGQLVKRYTKIHKVEGPLFEEGDQLAIFRIDDVPTTIMICHDERYPEIFRIPVLAGAKIGIYISCESKSPEQKMDNYRSQVMARAVENQITVIHCNTGDGGVDGGSHGHSRIIDPNGKIIAEADSAPDAVIRATIKPSMSRQDYAEAGRATPTLRGFWDEGLRALQQANPEYFAVTKANP
jgi:omega-amidase